MVPVAGPGLVDRAAKDGHRPAHAAGPLTRRLGRDATGTGKVAGERVQLALRLRLWRLARPVLEFGQSKAANRCVLAKVPDHRVPVCIRHTNVLALLAYVFT